jgi:hypothetical protein
VVERHVVSTTAYGNGYAETANPTKTLSDLFIGFGIPG